MNLPLEFGVLAFSSLFAVVNPIAAAPVFVALTKGAEARRRRSIALRAGLPVEVSGQTVNRFCSSGLQTIAMAAERIIANGADVIIAGGAGFAAGVGGSDDYREADGPAGGGHRRAVHDQRRVDDCDGVDEE